MRWLGLGPGGRPTRGLLKLQRLFHKHAFWARERSIRDLRRMLAGSNVVVSLWRGKRLVGFGRASSDGIHRAVLWDIVVAETCRVGAWGVRWWRPYWIAPPTGCGTPVSDDHQQCRVLSTTGLHQC